MTDRASAGHRSRLVRGRGVDWPLSRIIGVTILVVGLLAAIAIVFGGLAIGDLSNARGQVVDELDPAIAQSLRLQAALIDQETGIRGYALTGQLDFLSPYTDGRTTEASTLARLHQLIDGLPGPSKALTALVTDAETWRTTYAEPTMAVVRATGKPDVSTSADQGKADFDRVRAAATVLQNDLGAQRHTANASLSGAASALTTVSIAVAAALLLIIIVLGFGLRATAIRPLSRLAVNARQVAGGDFDHELEQRGPREVRDLASDVDRMRNRIVHELALVRAAHADLDIQRRDLQRSNSELEQFAYVASHDLQEPLRKVASFCQLLERRYGDQLDERGTTYIAFAVDGAKRMQVLINDLLAFSRVGRITRDRVPTPCATLVEQAMANLGPAAEQSDAVVEIGELPVVLAEAPLLTTVFQNLIGNALKFHGHDAPHVTVTASRDDDEKLWRFAVTDNGIGIQADYAERIFVIFQRLHGKDVYPGTGIGLAMCRKIVEYHGGTIWLDTTYTGGTRFCFTLPVLADDPTPADDQDPDPDRTADD
jgi:signal transduction histidine kinase